MPDQPRVTFWSVTERDALAEEAIQAQKQVRVAQWACLCGSEGNFTYRNVVDFLASWQAVQGMHQSNCPIKRYPYIASESSE